MRKFTIFSCIILFVIASCNNEDEISDSASLNNQDDSTSEIILQERDPNLPKVWSKKIAPRPSTRTSFTDATDFLGNSYAIENGTSIIGDFQTAAMRRTRPSLSRTLPGHGSKTIRPHRRTYQCRRRQYAGRNDSYRQNIFRHVDRRFQKSRRSQSAGNGVTHSSIRRRYGHP